MSSLTLGLTLLGIWAIVALIVHAVLVIRRRVRLAEAIAKAEEAEKDPPAYQIWKEGAEQLRPQPVSQDFIEGLKAAGARDTLIRALERQRRNAIN